MLTGEDGVDSELRKRMKRNVSELVQEYAMLKGEARKLVRVEKINFKQGEYVMLTGEMNLIRQRPFRDLSMCNFITINYMLIPHYIALLVNASVV